MQGIGLLTSALGVLIIWFQIEVILTEKVAGLPTLFDFYQVNTIKIHRLWLLFKVQIYRCRLRLYAVLRAVTVGYDYYRSRRSDGVGGVVVGHP